MSGAPIEELVVAYDLERVAAAAERRRRLFRSRLVSLGITIVVVVGFSVWLRSQGQAAGIWVSAAVIALSAVWVVIAYVVFRRARAELAELHPGAAIRISPAGVQVAELGAAWSDVASLSTVRGALGRSPRLRFELRDGRTASVALDQVSVMPATLDSTARIYSAGRHGVDLTALDA